jgi:hypothetical protein
MVLESSVDTKMARLVEWAADQMDSAAAMYAESGTIFISTALSPRRTCIATTSGGGLEPEAEPAVLAYMLVGEGRRRSKSKGTVEVEVAFFD